MIQFSFRTLTIHSSNNMNHNISFLNASQCLKEIFPQLQQHLIIFGQLNAWLCYFPYQNNKISLLFSFEKNFFYKFNDRFYQEMNSDPLIGSQVAVFHASDRQQCVIRNHIKWKIILIIKCSKNMMNISFAWINNLNAFQNKLPDIRTCQTDTNEQIMNKWFTQTKID